MAISILASRRVLLNVRCRTLQSRVLLKEFKASIASIRFSSSRATSPESSSKPNQKPGSWKKKFPERLLIYHAGTAQSAWTGTAKVTSIIVFSIFSGFLAPNFFASDDVPRWVPAVLFVSGVVPPIAVFFITRPFVSFIHLQLPAFARNSREIMLRYAKTLPKDAVLELTTINAIGAQRINKVKVSDLYPIQGRLKLANYGRDTRAINARRPWWMVRAVGKFNVHSKESKIAGGEAWSLIAASIAKRAPKN